MAIDALLSRIAEPRIYRAADDWTSPVLVIEGLRDCYRLRLQLDEESGLYDSATLEQISTTRQGARL